MKLFDKWFQKQCRKAWDAASKCDTDEHDGRNFKFKKASNKPIAKNNSDIIEDMSCYTFKLQPANGGTIVQVMHYFDHNKQNGEWIKDLYIIPDSMDLGEQLTSILVQYKLKHQ